LQVLGLPFEVRKKQPNKVTLAAMEEALMLAKDPDAKTYSSVEELKKDLDL
jgi:DNA-damage-inducible protein J